MFPYHGNRAGGNGNRGRLYFFAYSYKYQMRQREDRLYNRGKDFKNDTGRFRKNSRFSTPVWWEERGTATWMI